MISSIAQMQAYGTVALRLREVMDERGITRNELARSVQTRFEVVDKWYKNEVEKLDLDILARLCFALDCKVEDLLVYYLP